MSKKLDVDDLINWLNQSEDEAKATVAESGATADPFYDGVLSAIFQVREYIKKMRKIDDAEGKADQSWIPCSERFPDDDRYILVSFENSTLPDIARYERDDEGGAFYPGDDEKSYSSYGLFVNAWMPLPELYRREDEQDHEIN